MFIRQLVGNGSLSEQSSALDDMPHKQRWSCDRAGGPEAQAWTPYESSWRSRLKNER